MPGDCRTLEELIAASRDTDIQVAVVSAMEDQLPTEFSFSAGVAEMPDGSLMLRPQDVQQWVIDLRREAALLALRLFGPALFEAAEGPPPGRGEAGNGHSSG